MIIIIIIIIIIKIKTIKLIERVIIKKYWCWY